MVDIENEISMLKKADERLFEEQKEIIKRLNEKDISDAIMRQQLDTLVKTTSRIEEKVTEQAELPATRWNAIINTIITGVAGAIIGAVVGLIIKK